VRPKEINKSYIRFLFEDKSIRYVVTHRIEDIPQGIKDNLNSIYDSDLVREYYKRNKRVTAKVSDLHF